MHLSWLIVTAGTCLATAIPRIDMKEPRHENDFSCRSETHPNPVVALHGLFANAQFDLNFLEAWLRPQGYCTFSLTYGKYPLVPLGGLESIDKSSMQIAGFIHEVLNKTGAAKVDIVGHSEGALQSLYVPKFRGLAPRVDKVIAIAPPTRGSTVQGIATLAKALGLDDLLAAVGCEACKQVLVGSDLVKKLNNGPIAQPGNTVTVIMSRTDEAVTPPEVVSPIHEPGVANIFVQDYCPHDPVGHIGLAVDTNVWHLVRNSLESTIGRKFPCSVGLPIRRDDVPQTQ